MKNSSDEVERKQEVSVEKYFKIVSSEPIDTRYGEDDAHNPSNVSGESWNF